MSVHARIRTSDLVFGSAAKFCRALDAEAHGALAPSFGYTQTRWTMQYKPA